MATVNLGAIKFKWKGTYNASTAYTIDDVVEYNGSSYICILASTGNLPTNATYFEQMSSAGTNGTDGTDLGTTLTTQGDIVYRDASGLARLGAGTSGYFLKTQGTGANPTWAEVDGGAVKQIKQVMYSGHDTYSSSTYVNIPNFAVTITPTASNSSFLIMANIQAGHSNNDSASGFNIFDSQVGTSNGNEIFPNGVSSNSRSRTFQTGKFGLNAIGSVNNYINWQTNISAMYTPSSNNANARTFSVCQLNPNTTTYMNYNTDNHVAGMSTVSNMIVMEIANGIYS
jgi:hypothetical protein